MELVVLEGPRCTGKSTIGRALREQVNYCTLVNFTGFKEEGHVGLTKITRYYDGWFKALNKLEKIDCTVVCDRFFFSEMVFSSLYKDYSFEKEYKRLVRGLPKEGSVKIFHLYLSDESVVEERVKRDKVLFHNVQDTVENIKYQNKKYLEVFTELKDSIKYSPNIEIIQLDSSKMSLDDIQRAIKEQIGG